MSKSFKVCISIYAILILVFSSIYINNFRIDASSDTLVAQNDEDFKFYNYYNKIFPTKSSLVVAIKSNKEIDRILLKEIELLSNKISELEEIESVFNINKAPILFLNETSLLDLSNNNYETILNTKLNIEDVLEEFVNSPIYSNQIINYEKNITSLIIFLKPNGKLEDLRKNKNFYIKNNTYFKKKSEIDKKRNLFINKIRDILNKGNKNYSYYLGGVEMISSDVISFVKNDIFVFSASVILLIIFILFLIFRKIKWVFVILLSSAFGVYNMIGLVGYFNFEITAVSANFIALMFILSISMKIHILNNFLQSNHSLMKTLKIMFWPCFYTFLTTVVAFVSLMISDIKPVEDFGLVMIIALLVILVTAFTILPLLISFFPKDKYNINLKFNLINIFLKLSKNFKNQILMINFLFFILAIYGLTKLNVENSFIKYFKKNTEIFQGMKLIDSELGGTTPLDIILKIENDKLIIDEIKKDDDLEDLNGEDDLFEDDLFEDDLFEDDLFEDENITWFTDSKIETIKKIHEYLENRKEIGKVTSIYSLINVANQINKNELSNFELSILYNEIPDEYKRDLIYPYLNIEKNMVKISARVKDSEDIQRNKLINEINYFTKDSSSIFEEVRVNGLLVLYNNMLSSLFSSQIKSLGFVLLAIFFMFLLLFKSIKLSIMGIVPNILASTYILGIIGIFKIPLDIMTITIAAISIGIAVDNTIHYLYRYKINYINNGTVSSSIEKTHLSVGKAVLITSFAISFGFITLAFSNFIPTIIFGLFTSLAMIFAMIGVLITLPSILYFYK